MSQIWANTSLAANDSRLFANTFNLAGNTNGRKRGKWRRLGSEDALRALQEFSVPAIPEPPAAPPAPVVAFPVRPSPVLPDVAGAMRRETLRRALEAERARRQAADAVAAAEMMRREEEETMLLLLA